MALQSALTPPLGMGVTPPGALPAPIAANPVPKPQKKPAPVDLPDFDPSIDFRTQADREECGRMLTTKIRHSLSQLQDRHDRIRQFRDQYEATTYPKMTPWPNAASLNIPTTRAAVDTVHSDIVGAMTGTTPLFRTEAFSSGDQEDAQQIEQVLEWQVRDQIGLPAVWDRTVKSALIDGTGIAEVCWRKEARRVRKPGYARNDDGTTMLHPVTNLPVRALVEETAYVINQPDVIQHDVLDFVIYPARAKSIETAIGVGVRVWLTDNDLLRGVRDGLYDKDQVAKLLAAAPERPQVAAEHNGGDESRDSAAAIEYGEPVETEDRPMEFFRCVWLYDEDGDGIKEDCYFLVEMSTGIMVRAEIYPFWHNQRCFVDYTPIPREGHFFGYSVPEMIESLHEERNAIRNQRVDAGTLYLSPVLAAKRGIKFDTNKQRWRPGAVLYMDDPVNDLRPVSFQNVSQTAFAEEQKVQENVESLLGISEYSMGTSPSRSRTVGEISQVTSSGNKRIDTMIMRLHLSNNAVANQIIGLDAQYLDAETEYSLTQSGVRVFQIFDKSALATRVRIQAQGNTVNSNKEMTLQSAETLFQMAQNTPIMQKPTHLYAILADYLQAMGKTNVVPYIGTEQEARQAEQQADSAPPPPPPPPNISGKMDDTLVLAYLLQNNELNPQALNQAADLVHQYQLGTKAVEVLGDAATAQHQANVDTAHHVVRTVANAHLAPQPAPGAPPYPTGGASASPVPPAAPAGVA